MFNRGVSVVLPLTRPKEGGSNENARMSVMGLGVDVRASTNKRVLQPDITSTFYEADRRLTARIFGIFGIRVFVIWDAVN